MSGFSIVRELGRGGFGIVYLAHDDKLDRVVAVKILNPSRASDPRHRARFEDEMKRAARIPHPNIVTIHQLADDGSFAIMEYIEGESLEDRIKRGPLPALEAVEILAQVADAVAHAHAQGLEAHRDLKPANILLDRKGTPYVADFGLAIRLDDDRSHRAIRAGTPAYMRPSRSATHGVPWTKASMDATSGQWA